MTTNYKKCLGLILIAGAANACGIINGLNNDGGEDDCQDAPAVVSMELGSTDPRYESSGGGAPRPALVPSIETYSSCAALQDDLRQEGRTYRQYGDRYNDGMTDAVNHFNQPGCKRATAAVSASTATDAAPAVSGAQAENAASPDGGGQFTNTQEKNIDEGDTVKIGDHHLYVQRGREILVLGRQSLTLIGRLPVPEIANPKLYTDGDRLIVVGYHANQATVQIYVAADGQMPTLQKEHGLSGGVVESRYAHGILILTVRDTLPWSSVADATGAIDPIKVEGGAVNGVPCERIVKPAIHDGDTRLNKIVAINTSALDSPPQVSATIGGGDQIYMTETGLYITKTAFWTDSYHSVSNSYWQSLQESLAITKFSFDAATGTITPAAAGMIEGRVKDQWAFKEYVMDGEQLLAVATSTGHLFGSGADVAQNHLWILRQAQSKLDVAAAVRDYGTGEDIRSVRYVDDKAYVVTFKKTDPLFAFDLAHPLEPKLLGELKVPGFSVYMHPVAEGRMLGVGFDADDQGEFAWYQGLQVSLFDTSNPLDLKRLDNKIIGQRGSYSDVTGDHHAFYFDAAAKIVGIPVVELLGKEEDRGPTMATSVKFSGAILYRIDGDHLSETARLSHNDLLPDSCKQRLERGRWWQEKSISVDINRLYSLDGKLLTVSRFGLKTWNLAQPEQAATATLSFPTDGVEELCNDGAPIGL